MSDIIDPVADSLFATVNLIISDGILSTTETATSGTPVPYYFQALVDPASASTAIYPTLVGEAQYVAGASSISGGHLIGGLGLLTNNNTTQTLPEGLALEGRITNLAGTITTAISADLNIASNTGTITNWFGVYADVAGNAGTIGTAAAFTAQIDSNTGSIGTYAGFWFPTLNSPGTISGTTYGYFFGNNPSITGTKYAVYIADANASITTLGAYFGAAITSSSEISAQTLQVATGTKTATASSGAATLNKASGKITTDSLTTVALGTYTLTLTNSTIAAADVVVASVANGTNTASNPCIAQVTPAAGSVTIVLININTVTALNGTLVISFAVIKN